MMHAQTQTTTVEQLRSHIRFLESEIERLGRENSELQHELNIVRRYVSGPDTRPTSPRTGEMRRSDAHLQRLKRHNTDSYPQLLGDEPTHVGHHGHHRPSHSTDDLGRLGRALHPNESPSPYAAAAPVAPPPIPQAPMPEVISDQGGLDLGFINQADTEELNTLPYGLIILDNKGKVLFYNETESRLTGFRKARVEGRNFFQEIAPCTRVKAFEGRFKRFVRGELGPVVFFEFVFRFERGAQHVTIGFSRGRRRGTINVMMRRRTM